jgi:hypothetical protein
MFSSVSFQKKKRTEVCSTGGTHLFNFSSFFFSPTLSVLYPSHIRKYNKEMKKARSFESMKGAVNDVFSSTFHKSQTVTLNGKHEVGHAPIASTVKFSKKDEVVTLRLRSKCPEFGSEVVLETKNTELADPTLVMTDLPLYKGKLRER